MDNCRPNYRQLVLKKIEDLLLNVMKDISELKEPSLFYANNKTWNNIIFDDSDGLSMQKIPLLAKVSFEKMGLIFKLLSIIYSLVQKNIFSTKRDLYYQAPEMFTNQSKVDALISEIVLLLNVPRWQLHVMATSKGLIVGDLQFFDSDNFINCKNVTFMPVHIENIKDFRSKAEFVLVVEKDATFQKLVGDRFTDEYPCILMTAKGFPDMNSRAFLRQLSDYLDKPFYCLVDADPHGIEIMSTYKYGSMAMSRDNNMLAVPSLKWLGILPSDINRLQIPQSTLIPLTNNDIKKAKELLNRNYINEKASWKNEIEILLKMGKKSEIQCLDQISSTYLSKVYLPNKIKFNGWI